jgi:hypothetical protein
MPGRRRLESLPPFEEFDLNQCSRPTQTVRYGTVRRADGPRREDDVRNSCRVCDRDLHCDCLAKRTGSNSTSGSARPTARSPHATKTLSLMCKAPRHRSRRLANKLCGYLSAATAKAKCASEYSGPLPRGFRVRIEAPVQRFGWTPAAKARRTSSERLRAPILSMTRARWISTVRGLISKS